MHKQLTLFDLHAYSIEELESERESWRSLKVLLESLKTNTDLYRIARKNESLCNIVLGARLKEEKETFTVNPTGKTLSFNRTYFTGLC